MLTLRSIKRPDFRGFAQSLRLDPAGALYEVLIKYAISPIVSRNKNYKVELWSKKFEEILRHDKFMLIVLDDARYDFFRLLHADYFKGNLSAVKVPPPHTYGWLPEVFSNKYFNNIRVFYGSLGISSHDIRIVDFIPKGRNIEIFIVKPNKMKDIGTVLPEEINEKVREAGLSGRDMIWYVQPHFPWVCDPELSILLKREALLHDFVPPDNIRRALNRLRIDLNRVTRAYLCNLKIALKGAKDLVRFAVSEGINYDKIIITSDHGEMLGEYGLFLHQEYELPQLTLVPWLEVEV